MAENRQIREFDEIIHGTTASSNVKMADLILLQHEDVSGNVNTFNRFTVGQTLCQPVAVTANSTPGNGAYTATCNNFPDFAVSYTDKNGNSHFLIGMKVRVVFTTGITYGSTSANPVTYPTLNINSTGAYPLLAQGMTMGAGAASAGQTLELTLIPYGSNSVAWDADTNVREKSSTETVYVDGTKRIDTVTTGSKDMVTSGAIDNAIKDGDKALICSGDSLTDSFDIDNLPIDGIRHYREHYYSAIPWKDNNGIIINIPWTNSHWGMQIACDDESNLIAIRSKNNNVWNNWERLLKASEMGYSSYYDSWYSSNDYNDGYLLISEVNFSSTLNQDVGFSGKIYISEASIVNIAYFTATYRARGGSYVTSSFTVNPLGGNDISDDIKCTISNASGNISIRLYYKIKSYYTRVGVLFDGLYAGDVMIRREPTSSHVSFPFTVSNTMTGDVVTVKKLPLGNVSNVTTIVNDTDADITFCSYGKVGIFSVHAKKSATKQIDISNLGVKVFGQGYKQTMSWSSSSISGECWISSSSSLSIDTGGQCSCSLTVFLE